MIAAPSSRAEVFALRRGERLSMEDEVRATGLAPAPDREPRAPRRGRRSPFRHPRHDRQERSNERSSRSEDPEAGDSDVRGPTYAALDLGTNNCRLLVARATRDSFRVIDAFSRIIRLGEGITASGRLSAAAIARAVDALRVCRIKMRNRGVVRTRLIATEACRAAANGGDFLERVRNEVGIELEIVDRETEAGLAATGCTPLIDPQAKGVILFDIGGGSSELVRLGRCAPTRHGPPHPDISAWMSIPVGVVTLAERYGGVTVGRDLFELMIEEVTAHISDFAAANGGTDGIHLLGTSGTVTTIAGVYLELPRYERRRVDGCWMSGAQVDDVVERLLGMSYESRVANPCIGVERADLVLAGCAILEAIRRAFPCDRLRVADRGLREGMLVQMMREDGVWDEA
jgi:exopolyphosphatase/guanosine-5'-triphosphate,3'-diphosphate pyrophosphatase